MKKRDFITTTIGLLFFLYSGVLFSQKHDIEISSRSVFYKLKIKDSVMFYQCHVESGTQQLSTASGQTVSGSTQKYSLTEKFVLTRLEKGYAVKYFNSSYTIFPNKKFAGLKFKERKYWDFNLVKSFLIEDKDLLAFLALEEKGRDAVVYDYGIDNYTTNQLIIRYPDDYKQLVIDGPYVLSKLVQVKDR